MMQYDVISPCVTFNDHVGSTKSYLYTRKHTRRLTESDFVPPATEILANIGSEDGRVLLLDRSRLIDLELAFVVEIDRKSALGPLAELIEKVGQRRGVGGTAPPPCRGRETKRPPTGTNLQHFHHVVWNKIENEADIRRRKRFRQMPEAGFSAQFGIE